MQEHVAAYRAQIEAAGLPIVEVSEDGGWTVVAFKYQFNTVTLGTPDENPHYCRLLLGFSLEPTPERDRLAHLERANAGNDSLRIVKTMIGFHETYTTLRFACEFHSGAGFAIVPELRYYLDLLGTGLTTFYAPEKPSGDEEPTGD